MQAKGRSFAVKPREAVGPPDVHVQLARVHDIEMVALLSLCHHILPGGDVVLAHHLLKQLHLLLIKPRKDYVAACAQGKRDVRGAVGEAA